MGLRMIAAGFSFVASMFENVQVMRFVLCAQTIKRLSIVLQVLNSSEFVNLITKKNGQKI